MSQSNAPPPVSRAEVLFNEAQQTVAQWTDRNFALLMLLQFLFGVVAAFWISPLTWRGEIPETHVHVWSAIVLGGLITSLPVFLALRFPGQTLTRHVVAIGQTLMGALLIHLTGGRIETHFHVFGSLAFLAFYRDWKVIVTATVVIGLDHFLRGMFWPRSVFGVNMVEPFRWLEHVAWVLFEDLFLWVSISQSVKQSRTLAQRQSDLEAAKSVVESERDHFFDMSLDPFCVANLDGKFVRVNPMFPLKLGYAHEELLANPLLDFVHPDDRKESARAFQRLGRGDEVIDFENRFRRRDGKYLWLSWSARAGKHPETLVYAVAHDVTARKEAAQALEHARQVAEEARVSAEQANQAKSLFLANMSHEIRTPMNAVLGLTELVLETELTSTQRDYLSTVRESGESLLTIINEILDFSKIEAGKVVLEPGPLNLRDVLGDVMKSLASRAHRKQLELACHVDVDVPEVILADALRLRQVLVNLVGNAIKFTASGEVVLDVQCLSKQDQQVELRFRISDTGIGIPKEKLDAIFGEFQQADSSTTREFGGTGLGLSISSRLVDLMGGRIEVESEVGKGSTFSFNVPFEFSDQADANALRADAQILNGMQMLIVDDNATNLNILKESVANWGVLPTTADSGDGAILAIQQMQSSGNRPAVILTDMQMPKMDGYMLAEKIRAMNHLDDTVIILLTSAGRTDDPDRKDKLRISAELLKPVKQSELLDAILLALANEDGRGDAVSPVAQRHQSESPVDLHGLRVLLVEDGLANQKLALGMLKKWGHQVAIANHGRAALERLERESFDLILMDVQMPEMDGISATKIIREREQIRGGHIPILAMTAHALKGDRERCLAAGMDGYVAKPFNRREVYKAIQQLFSNTDRTSRGNAPDC